MLGSLVYWPQHPVGSAYLSRRFPDRKASVLSWHTVGGSIGSLVVPLLAGALIHAYGWRWAMIGIAIPMAAGGLVVAATLPREPRETEAGEAAERPPLRRALLQRRTLVVLAASTIAAGGRGLGVLSVNIPAYLSSGLHMPPLSVSGLFTVVTAGAILGPIAAGYVADRVGHRATLLAAYGLGAAAICAFVLVGSGTIALAVTGLAIGIFAYAESPLLQSLFADTTQGSDGRSAFGVYFAIAYGVGSLWFSALGVIITSVGFEAAFFTMGASFVVAGLLLAFAM